MRTRESFGGEDFDWLLLGAISQKRDLTYKLIADVNNKRLRPLSPVRHLESTFSSPTAMLTRYNYKAIPDISIRNYAEYCVTEASATITDHYTSCMKAMSKKKSAIEGEFSSLNFLYELREIGGLFKRLQDYRYIDYAFGVAPMIADIKTALKEYDNRASALNDRLKRFVDTPFNARRISTIFVDGSVPGHTIGETCGTSTLRVTTHIGGTLNMNVPYLAQTNPGIYQVLDQLSIDISASNAWEAIPWSWFVDWFLPVGQMLDSLPSVMRPAVVFHGSISHKMTGFSEMRTTTEHYLSSDQFTSGTVKYYTRMPLSGETFKLIKWRVGNFSNPAQLLILRDIAFPTGKKKRS